MNVKTKLALLVALLASLALPLSGCGDDSADGTGGDGDGAGDGDGHDAAHDSGDGDGHDAVHDSGDGDGHDAVHDSGDGDGDTHDHTSCGLQENCTGDEKLEKDMVVDGKDGNFKVKILMHNDLSVNMNEWMVQIQDKDGNPVEGADVSASTWSVDCMHAGPEAPEELTSNAMGHVTAKPVSVHGGPWNAVFDIEKDGTEDQVVIPLCIPGEAHGGATDDDAGVADHSAHDA